MGVCVSRAQCMTPLSMLTDNRRAELTKIKTEKELR